MTSGTPTRRQRGFAALAGLVARRDYVRTVRRRGFVLGTALVPFGLASFALLSELMSGIGEPGSPGAGPIPGPSEVVVVNGSALPIGRTALSPSVRVAERDAALAELGSGDIGEIYIVPAAYPEADVERVVAEPATGIEVLQRRARQERELEAALRSALLQAAGFPEASIAQVLEPLHVSERTLGGAPSSDGFDAAAFFLPYALTLLFVISIFTTSGYLLQSVTEEKENRVVEIVLSSVPALPLMAGKILGLGAAGLTQVAVWIAAAAFATPLLGERAGMLVAIGQALDPITVALAIVYFALGYLCYGAIFSAIGAVAPGSREAQQYAGFFGFFAVIPLIFTPVFLTDLASPVVLVLSLIPLTAPAAMLLVVALAPEPPWALVAASLLSLTLFTGLAAAASARVFRATLLLYGMRPGVRRILAAMLARS